MTPPIRIFCLAVSLAGLAACATVKETNLPAPPPVKEPPGLAGLPAEKLRIAFGAPAFVRKDGKDELWRYDGASCKAFFFLYPDGDALAVRHVETLPRGREYAADTVCLNALRASASPPVS